MSPQVDPKNKSRRQDRDESIYSKFSQFLPGRLYLRAIIILLVIILVAWTIYDFSWFVNNHSRYQADVIIRGTDTLSTQQVINRLSTIDQKEGFAPLSEISVASVRRELRESIPRFEGIKVFKEYPDKLVLSVEEREPVALVARSSEKDRRIFLPAGKDGRLYRPTREEVEELPGKLPVVRGFEDFRPGSSEFNRRWERVREFLEAVQTADSMERFKWIKVRAGGFLEAGIERPKTLTIRFGQADYSKKLTRLLEMMQTDQFLTIEKYVNLSDLDNVRIL